MIPERNILNSIFFEQPEERKDFFNKIELYYSKYSGFGKTAEIIYKIKKRRGKYYYLPIGGSLNRDYLINNLENLNLDLKKGKESYLHLDLSETDNDDLMNEVLFKLLILRFIDSNEKIFYLGNDIHLIIEIPNGYVLFNKKYKLLNLFKKKYICKLNPLRLEPDVRLIRDSPISIVAEVLSLYESDRIGTQNIDLDSPIRKNAFECETIINKYFKVENHNYYQKINFIKILSVQFKKFTENIYFYCETPEDKGKEDFLKKVRISVIKNFISLANIFTCSPFDSILFKKKKTRQIFKQFDKKEIIQEEIKSLDKEGQKISSFGQIEKSLVFFNLDGYSLSIISNNDKNSKDYKDLKALWNSQNFGEDEDESNELLDYKNMKHKDFLIHIKKLFSINKMNVEELEKLCEKLDNYIFVFDNYIKMIRILLNIEAKIPVILMGETGVGKTKLLEMLATLYGKGICKLYKLQIHAGITDQNIVDFIKEIQLNVQNWGIQNEKIWIFFDEINTCNSLGLITEIMCNHTYFGNKINDDFIFLAACNPYRILDKKKEENHIVYYNIKEKTKLNNLVYNVNALPHSLLNFVFDFASLNDKDEFKYINNTIITLLCRYEKEGLIKDINNEDLKNITNEIIQSISICHNFIKQNYDKSSISLREIRRFGIFFEYFIKYYKKSNKNYKLIMKSSLNMAIYLCYYLRFNDKKYRKNLARKLKIFYEETSFKRFPESEIKYLTEQITIKKGRGLVLNRILKENLFTCFTCIKNKIPLIIVGKPGTGKSLSFKILYDSLNGNYLESTLFQNKEKLYRYFYQGSETSTSFGIIAKFNKAINAHKRNSKGNIIILVYFEQISLADKSNNNPLKILHFLLERDNNSYYPIPFLGISNWRIDAATMNRVLSLEVNEYDVENLEEIAFSLARNIDEELAQKYRYFFEILAKTYNKYYQFNKDNIQQENQDFHGIRDFYNLIKIAMEELIEKKNELIKQKTKILIEVGIFSLNRNFGGLENSSTKINEIFKKEYAYKYGEQSFDIKFNFSVLDYIRKNIMFSNKRYLMLISEENDGIYMAKYIINSLFKKYIELVGSKFKLDLKSEKYSKEILNRIKYIVETDNVLILKDLDDIYPFLYDLFSQNFAYIGEKRFVNIAFDSEALYSEVHKDFRIIIIVNSEQIKNKEIDLPLLSRFEKHIINFNMLLDEIDIEISKKIYEYIEFISSFNNNKNSEIDLKNLLINC